MIQNNKPSISTNDINASASYLMRVVGNDVLRRGVAGAIASLLVAAVCEAVWPNR